MELIGIGVLLRFVGGQADEVPQTPISGGAAKLSMENEKPLMMTVKRLILRRETLLFHKVLHGFTEKIGVRIRG